VIRFVAGVLVSELFALWLEVFYKFGFQWNAGGFLAAIPFYFVFVSGLHFAFSRLEDIRRHRLVCFLLGGTAGLLLLEWFLVGNTPWNKPNAIQSAQFLFHAVYPLLGYLLVRVGPVKRAALVWYMAASTAITSVAFALPDSPLRSLWFLFVPLLVYVGLCYFLYQLSLATPLLRESRE